MKMTIEVEGFKFEWSGGPYVDVHTGHWRDPHTCINMWDYEKGAARVPFTLAAFAAEVNEWLEQEYAECSD